MGSSSEQRRDLWRVTGPNQARSIWDVSLNKRTGCDRLSPFLAQITHPISDLAKQGNTQPILVHNVAQSGNPAMSREIKKGNERS